MPSGSRDKVQLRCPSVFWQAVVVARLLLLVAVFDRCWLDVRVSHSCLKNYESEVSSIGMRLVHQCSNLTRVRLGSQ